MHRKEKRRAEILKQRKDDTAQTEDFKQVKDITEIINQDNENSPAPETGKSLFSCLDHGLNSSCLILNLVKYC